MTSYNKAFSFALILLIPLLFLSSCTTIPDTNIFITDSNSSSWWVQDLEGNIYNNNYIAEVNQEINSSLNTEVLAYYKLNGNVIDETGVYNGINYGVTFDSGVINQAGIFDGVSDYISCGNMSSINNANKVTLSAWAKKSHSSKTLSIIGYRTSDSDGIWLLWWNTNEIFLSPRNGAGTSVKLAFPFTTDWVHIVGVYDGTLPNDERAKLYINGDLATTSTIGTIPVSLSSTAGNNCEIGKWNTFFGSGHLDDVRVYNRSLNQTEIYNLYTHNFTLLVPGSNYSKEVIVKSNFAVDHNTTLQNLTVAGDFSLVDGVEDDLFFPINIMRVAGAKMPEQDLYTLNFDDSTEEEAYLTMQLPHKREIGSDMEPHWHWQTEDNTSGDVVWCMEFSNANIGDSFSTPATKCVISSSLNDSTKHIMSPEINIPNVMLGVSAMGKIRIYRDSTNVNDTYGADAQLIQYDIHIKIDKLGAEP